MSSPPGGAAAAAAAAIVYGTARVAGIMASNPGGGGSVSGSGGGGGGGSASVSSNGGGGAVSTSIPIEAPDLEPEEASATPGTTIIVQGNLFADEEGIDYLVAKINQAATDRNVTVIATDLV